uniref:Uncharacterized protein n=1 Tax=Anguilla anguilla TaxID=7936 RepID=A0A0E9P981_ANGAN
MMRQKKKNPYQGLPLKFFLIQF